MANPVLGHCALQRTNNVGLASKGSEGARAESTVERHEGVITYEFWSCSVIIRHEGQPTGGVSTLKEWRKNVDVRCGGQVDCGTLRDPLRAAAFRP